jgi:putative molybdopterin biosynthesis protein
LVQLEEAGYVSLVRTREVRGFTEKYYQATAQAYWVNLTLMPKKSNRGTIVCFGSHDPALEVLALKLNSDPNNPRMISLPVGSLDGLIALRQGFCQFTGCHLYDPVGGEYNTSFVRHLFPGKRMHLITLAHREQGLLLAPGNPCQIHGLEDLNRDDLSFINRKQGSGTRFWLDHQLRTLGVESAQVKGYDREVNTHSQVAEAVLIGDADLGLGVLAAAQQFELDYLPLFQERFDLVIPETYIEDESLIPFFDTLNSGSTHRELSGLMGYSTAETGREILVQ